MAALSRLITFLFKAMTETYTQLLTESQPQIITNDDENAVNLAHIERLLNADNLTADEEKILQLLSLLSEQYEAIAPVGGVRDGIYSCG
jgi:hypothetical protein